MDAGCLEMAWPTKEQKEAKRLADMEVAAAPAQVLDQAAIAAMIQDAVSESVSSLRRELREVRDGTPRIVPRETPADPNARRRSAIAELQRGQQAEGNLSRIPTDYRGQVVGAGHAPPMFRDRDSVRIRADVAREGFPKAGDPFPAKYDIDLRGRKRVSRDWTMWSRIFPGLQENGDTFPRDVVWGDILQANRCTGDGVITYSGQMSRIGVWKYRVRVPGITQESGDSAYEFELMEAT